jgi:hypothetical protein
MNCLLVKRSIQLREQFNIVFSLVRLWERRLIRNSAGPHAELCNDIRESVSRFYGWQTYNRATSSRSGLLRKKPYGGKLRIETTLLVKDRLAHELRFKLLLKRKPENDPKRNLWLRLVRTMTTTTTNQCMSLYIQSLWGGIMGSQAWKLFAIHLGNSRI